MKKIALLFILIITANYLFAENDPFAENTNLIENKFDNLDKFADLLFANKSVTKTSNVFISQLQGNMIDIELVRKDKDLISGIPTAVQSSLLGPAGVVLEAQKNQYRPSTLTIVVVAGLVATATIAYIAYVYTQNPGNGCNAVADDACVSGLAEACASGLLEVACEACANSDGCKLALSVIK